jgi:lipid-binding SYLF domain-containing protein
MGGNGVAVKKLPSGWSAPIAIGVVKGDFGALIGAQHLDIVMVFNDATAFDKFIESGSYFYAGAQGTAATTTATNQASGPPVKSYAHAAGLYGGASIGGLGILIKEKTNEAAYGVDANPVDILNGKFPQPPGGIELSKKLDSAR